MNTSNNLLNKNNTQPQSGELQRADKGFLGALKLFFMSKADRLNTINRNIAEYKPATIASFFAPSNGVYNSVVSGGDSIIRVSAAVAQAVCAVQNNFPVIVLHEGNKNLAHQLKNNFSSSGRYFEVSSSSPCFEPFYQLDEFQIANQIIETAPKDFDIKFSARYYIEGMGKYLHKSGKHLSFKMLSTCPHSLLFDKVEELRLQGKISDSEEQELKSKLMMGQSENYKIDTFLATLQREISSVMYRPKMGYKPVNIISTLKKDGILCLDINSVTNKLFISTLISQLNLALTMGLQYVVIIDSIPIDANEKYAAYIKAPSNKICKMICTDDLYSMVGGDEKLFAAVVGNSQISVIMNHRSGNSATKWAEVIGQYDRYDESYSTSTGGSRAPFEIFETINHQKSVSLSKNRAFIVQPEQIARMGQTEAYILTAALGELAHLYFLG